MWQPEPDWHPLPGGAGPSTLGVWRTALGGRPVVVKRLLRPDPREDAALLTPSSHAYWRREADVLMTGLVLHTRGLRTTAAAVEEDEEGVTLTQDWVEDDALPGLFVAMALGRFAGSELPRPRFLARDLLRDRLALAERRGGWSTLARTTLADVAAHLWTRRSVLLDLVDALPQVPAHGDPTRANLRGRHEDDVVALDWAALGTAGVGTDLGLYALGAREELDPLVEAYRMGLPPGLADLDQVLLGARVAAVLTALGRADWALSRVAGGEGALAGKFRHPAVAPHLRALQRQHDAIEALLEV